jgi:hypothetical protein
MYFGDVLWIVRVFHWRYTEEYSVDNEGKAALAALEAVIWQLVNTGVLRGELLAAELERYATFSEETAKPLGVLSLLVTAAIPSTRRGDKREPAGQSDRRWRAERSAKRAHKAA